MRFYYRLTTEEPLVLGQSSATTNNHLGLDYIPGSAILGAIASRLYKSGLDEKLSFQVFHSGACRFGPAYPVVADEIALPVPASWHTLKNDSHALSNHAAKDFTRESQKQYKQRREGYLSHDLEEASIKQGLTTRTALNDDLSVKDGRLYTYTTLEAGQEFGGWIDVDSNELVELIRPFLNGELLIGRARSSEFGRVKLRSSLVEAAAPKINPLDKTLVLWCLSDAQCLNNLGSPTFTPEVSTLHPQLKGVLNPAKSFIRTRKVRRFNRARGGLDTEQQLIAAGSILVYDLDEAASDVVLSELATKGIGLNRQQGLGWVYVNPNWSAYAEPQGQLFEPIRLPIVEKSTVNYPVSDLLSWVQQQVNTGSVAKSNEEKVLALHHKVAAAYDNARIFNNIQNEAGPSSSQWRRLDELVKNTSNWQKDAFDKNTGVCKASNDELGWGLSWQQDGKLVTFADFTEQHLSELSSEQMRLFLEQLCRFDPSTRHGLADYKYEFKKEGEKA